MKRRLFFQTIAALPAAPALLAEPQARVERSGSPIPAFDETAPDVAGEGEAKFFTAAQFAALKRLSALLLPPLKGNPGAVECGVPEFLDFLVGVSSAERQNLYRSGLDGLNAAAKQKYAKAFADLIDAEADGVVRPLLVEVPWTYDLPKDPMQHFVACAHEDIRQAAANSRQWAETAAAGGRRRFGGQGQYLKPIDPIYRS